MHHNPFKIILAILIISLVSCGCKSDKNNPVKQHELDNQKKEANVIDVITRSMEFQMVDTIPSGKHTFGVTFVDQKQYETLLGHDVNLVKIDDFSNLDSLNLWINAADITAFRTPAPKGITFLGGVNDSPAGSTGYFTVDLKPGNYAFISEVPNANEKGMLKTFTISE